jgi:hypothetical protein
MLSLWVVVSCDREVLKFKVERRKLTSGENHAKPYGSCDMLEALALSWSSIHTFDAHEFSTRHRAQLWGLRTSLQGMSALIHLVWIVVSSFYNRSNFEDI